MPDKQITSKICTSVTKWRAVFLLFFAISSSYVGKNTFVNAPSAVIRLKKFGSFRATKKASEAAPAPSTIANNTSLTKPKIRLIAVKNPTCLNPRITENELVLEGFIADLFLTVSTLEEESFGFFQSLYPS